MKATIHQKINVKSWFCSLKELPASKMRIKRSNNYNRSDYDLERESPYTTNNSQIGRVSKKNLFLAKF